MADLKMVLGATNDIKWKVDRILKLSTYDEYDDLGGLEIDYKDGGQLFLLGELQSIMESLNEARSRLEYSVQVPALLELDYNSSSGKYEGDYQVSAKGNIQPDKSVTIQPTESSFTLTGTLSGETSQAVISQEVTEWVHSSKQADGTGKVHIGVEEYTEAQGSVSAELTQADSYTGEITFAFSLGDCTE